MRMDMYRLFKSKMLYVVLGLMALMSAFMVFMMWLSTTPEFAMYVTGQMTQQELNDMASSGGFSVGVSSSSLEGLNGTELADFTRNQTSMWMSAGALGCFVSVVIALFFVLDFTSGYVKNLPSSRRDRLAYYGEKMVLVVLLTAVFLAFDIATFEIARSIAGLTYAHVDSVGDVAAWFGLSVLLVSVYGALTAVVTWLTQSKAAGLAVGLVVGSSMAGSLLAMALSSLGAVWEPLARVAEWLPYSSYALLAQGGEALLASPGDVGHILVTCGVALVACTVVALGVCSRKDV